MNSPEFAIHASLPGDENRGHRVCLLRLVHAAQTAERNLEDLAMCLSEHLLDFSHTTGSWTLGAAETLADRLELAAREIRKSTPDLLRYASNRFYANLPEETLALAAELDRQLVPKEVTEDGFQ